MILYGAGTQRFLTWLVIVQVCVAPCCWSQQPSADKTEPASESKGSVQAPGGSANLINESQLLGLPLNGRSYSQLATLEAGVSDPSSSSASRGVSGGNLSVSGSRSTSNH